MIFCQSQPRKNFCPEQKMHVERRINKQHLQPSGNLFVGRAGNAVPGNPVYGSGGPALMR
jgi:hypothetical protein